MSKKTITKKEEIIMQLLYLFRFLNSKQIQVFLGHKDHRRINSWLRDLTIKAFIEKEFTPVYGMLTKPAVYHLAAKGRKYVKDSFCFHTPEYLRRIARDTKASKAFRSKCELIAEWYLILIPLQYQRKNAESIDYRDTKGSVGGRLGKGKSTGIPIVDSLKDFLNTDPEKKSTPKFPYDTLEFFTPASYPSFSLLQILKPHAYIRRKANGGIRHGLLYVLDPYVSKLYLAYTLKHLFETLDQEYWEEDNIYSLTIYFLCPNNQVLIYMKNAVKRYIEEKYISDIILNILFATRNELYRAKDTETKKIKWQILSSQSE